MSAGGGKRYGSGRRLLSPGSFVRSIEKRSDSRSSWLKSHGRIYVRRDILDTFKTLKAQCVFSTDTAFLQHLLSFEMRRQQSLKAKQAMKKSTEESSAVQQPQADDSNFHTSTPVKRGQYDGSVIAPPVESPVAGMAGDNSDIDITGTNHSEVNSNSDSSSNSSTTDSSAESEDDNCFF
ncbi:hypothetical protein ABFA07_008588 [Porites harrisoni]